jgi:hypothetical protein
MLYGFWVMVIVYGVWFMAYGSLFIVCGVSFMVYGLWFMVVAYGIWFVAVVHFSFLWFFVCF